MSRRRRRKNKNKPQQLEKKVIHYKQCKLKKGPFCTTSWVPEEFAEVGKYVRLKKEDSLGVKKWDNGWLVTEVSSRTKEEAVMVRSENHKKRQGM